MNINSDVKIEFGGAAPYQCPCCGRQSETVHGYLYRSDGTTSVYLAGFTHGHPERRANMVLSVGAWGEGTTPAERKAIALQAIAQGGAITFSFPPPESSPWSGTDFLGAMVSPEGLSSDASPPILQQSNSITRAVGRLRDAMRAHRTNAGGERGRARFGRRSIPTRPAGLRRSDA